MLTALILNSPKNPNAKDRKKFWLSIAVWGGVLFLVWPIFRSGQRENLTGFQWLINHTRWGPPVEFVPLEDYDREFEGTWLDEEGNLHW